MIKAPISLQDLRRRIYVKAKAEPSWRFWGLYVHVCKPETLQAAYKLAKKNDAPGQEADGAVAEAQGLFPEISLPARGVGGGTHQPDSSRLGELFRHRPLKSVLFLREILGREEDTAPPGEGLQAPRFRLEAVEYAVAHRDVWTLQ